MHPFQRMAWFNLTVVLFTVLVFTTFYGGSGSLDGAQATLGCTALALLSGLFLIWGKGREPLWDEYHRQVLKRSINAATLAGCAYYILVGWLIMHLEAGKVPGDIFAVFLWGGFPLLLAVQSLTLLLLYDTDGVGSGTPPERRRGLGAMRRSALWMSALLFIIQPVFMLIMLNARDNNAYGKMIFIDAVTLALYLLFYLGLGRFARGEADLRRLGLARRNSLKTLGFMPLGVIIIYPALKYMGVPVPLAWFCFYCVFYGLFNASLQLIAQALIVKQPAETIFWNLKRSKKNEPEGKAK